MRWAEPIEHGRENAAPVREAAEPTDDESTFVSRANAQDMLEAFYLHSGKPVPLDSLLRERVSAFAKMCDPLRMNRVRLQDLTAYMMQLAKDAAPKSSDADPALGEDTSADNYEFCDAPARGDVSELSAEDQLRMLHDTACVWLGAPTRAVRGVPALPMQRRATARAAATAAMQLKTGAVKPADPLFGRMYVSADAKATATAQLSVGSAVRKPVQRVHTAPPLAREDRISRRHRSVLYAAKRTPGMLPPPEYSADQQCLDLHAWERPPPLAPAANERKFLQWDKEGARRERIRLAAVPQRHAWGRAEMMPLPGREDAGPVLKWPRPASSGGRGRWVDGGLRRILDARRRRERALKAAQQQQSHSQPAVRREKLQVEQPALPTPTADDDAVDGLLTINPETVALPSVLRKVRHADGES
eukprot:TRINITY_DN1064_c1_g1_i6.p1 TRINITY_DN1064_c1_g1~~TRINITY_DN1064_c1_g1_i6.p1  ORF type:complete len:447 (+),score=55.05 TRINITY_DN1064_c1_g1_i6:92-1342(+)